MISLRVNGEPKPRQSVKSTVMWKPAALGVALRTLRGGLSPKAAKAVLSRAFFVKLYQPTSSNKWRQEIERAAKQARITAIEKGEPVALQMVFRLPRPKAHYGTGRNAEALRASAPAYPVNKKTGDTTNLLKLAEDALNGLAYDDDCQIVQIQAVKLYASEAHPPGVDITVQTMAALLAASAAA